MQAPPARPTLDIRRETKRCPSCGQRFSPDAAFCPFEGTRLEPAAFDPLGDPLIGTAVDDRYQVVALLGEGGMGKVYEVRHASLDRPFALKVLRRELARDGDLALRFIDEARATASVRHPNVVQITDFGKLGDGAPYFVMELLEGQTLGHVIKTGGPLPSGRAVRVATQIAAALGAAHEAGVVHRDLKPDNVFLVGGMSGGRASDDVRVVDFGAAKIIGSSRVTRQGIVFGTPHYMSPEQASGQPVDHRADIYALGVILYEMFTGRVPFEADTYMGVLTQHMFVQPLPPSQASPSAAGLGALEEITLRCLAKKPEERYPQMADVADALASVVRSRSDGSVEIAPRTGSQPPASVRYRMADELEPPTLQEMRVAIDSVLPPRRPVPWGWIGAAGLAIAALAAAGLLAGRGRASAPAAQVPSGLPAPASSAALSSALAAIPPPASAAPSAEGAPAPSAPPPGATPSPAPRKRTPSRPRGAVDDIGDPFTTKR